MVPKRPHLFHVKATLRPYQLNSLEEMTNLFANFRKQPINYIKNMFGEQTSVNASLSLVTHKLGCSTQISWRAKHFNSQGPKFDVSLPILSFFISNKQAE